MRPINMVVVLVCLDALAWVFKAFQHSFYTLYNKNIEEHTVPSFLSSSELFMGAFSLIIVGFTNTTGTQVIPNM